MSLQGSIHRLSNGIGYGAYIPTKQAYYNIRTPPTRLRRPSSERTNYRRHNATAGVDTHRSDISFGRTSWSIEIGEKGNSRAREANKYLTSGEIGDFCLPAEQAAHIGNAEDNSGAAAPKASLSSSFLPFEAHKESSQKEVGAGMEDQRQQSGKTHRLMDSCIGTARSSHQSYSFRRSSMCSSCSTVPSSTLDKDSGRSSSRPYSRCSGYSDSSHRDRVGSEGRIGRQTTHPTSPARIDDASFVGHMSRHSDCSSSRREERLRLRLFKDDEARQQQQSLYQGSSSTHRFGRHIDLDPAFDRHHRYDLIAHLRAEEGKEVTGRFGPVNANSVMAASSLTSKLSLPWSHKLRGQK